MPSFEFRTEIREGYVFVWQRGLATSVEDLEPMQAGIAGAFAQLGCRRAMFDNRETERPDPMVRSMMWTWLCENVDRAALLQKEARNIKRAERTGQDNRMAVRAFHDIGEAEAWLVS